MPAVSLMSPAGRLVARHDPPAAPPPSAGPRVAVICHPHPLYGGTLDNKVVYALAKACSAAGLHALRFNFRGAGGSEGRHDEGRGELDDARAALDAAVALAAPAAPAALTAAATSRGPAAGDCVLMAGFSFGAFVALSAGLNDPRVGALLAVAPPVQHYDFTPVAATSKPLAVIYALGDELVPAALVEAWLARCTRPPRVTAVAGATHLFHGKLSELRTATAGYLAELAASAC
ncbi:MAG: alpha/beta hydrolase [Planctomycetota bacterium]